MPKKPLPEPGQVGSVYLVHLAEPVAHAHHYIGWALSVPARMNVHRAARRAGRRGSRLLAAANARGIAYEDVRTWEGKDRRFERQLKNQANASRLCPVCNPDGWKRHMPEV